MAAPIKSAVSRLYFDRTKNYPDEYFQFTILGEDGQPTTIYKIDRTKPTDWLNGTMSYDGGDWTRKNRYHSGANAAQVLNFIRDGTATSTAQDVALPFWVEVSQSEFSAPVVRMWDGERAATKPGVTSRPLTDANALPYLSFTVNFADELSASYLVLEGADGTTHQLFLAYAGQTPTLSTVYEMATGLTFEWWADYMGLQGARLESQVFDLGAGQAEIRIHFSGTTTPKIYHFKNNVRTYGVVKQSTYAEALPYTAKPPVTDPYVPPATGGGTGGGVITPPPPTGNTGGSTGGSTRMPWLSIIMAVLSFLTSLKKNPGDKGKAIAVGALAGLGTYYVTHETDWGSENLGALDGVVKAPVVASTDPTATTLPDGSVVSGTHTSVPSSSTGTTKGVWDVIKDVGPAGIATGVGAIGVATGALDPSKLLMWGAIALIAIKVIG